MVGNIEFVSREWKWNAQVESQVVGTISNLPEIKK